MMFTSLLERFQPNRKTIKRTTSSLLRAHSRSSLNRLLFESEHANGGGHDERTIAFRSAQIVVMAMRLVTPLSYLYLIYMAIYLPNILHNTLNYRRCFQPVQSAFTIWMIVEAIFFPYYCHMFIKLLKINNNLSHFGSTPSSRSKLVRNCFEALQLSAESPDEAHLYIRKAMEGYFLDVPIHKIYRDNFRSWVSWAFFGRDLKDLSKEEYTENEEYVRYIEQMAQWTFEEGYSKNLMALRLTLDPLFATQRPFLFYAVIMFVNYVTHVILFLLGFRRRRSYDTKSQAIYYRPKKKTNRNGHHLSNGQNSSDNKCLPIVFIHGIGIGFAHYLLTILHLPDDVDVYLVEWPHVAMQLRSTVPTSNEVVCSIVRILDDDKQDSACFVAHSLGTTAVSWMVHHHEGKKKVAATVLLDPVTFLLCDPTVATTFVYKDPTTTLDFLMHFFVSRELFIANTLSRHFSWSENIMFVEDLEECSRYVESRSDSMGSSDRYSYKAEESALRRKKHTIVISTHDTIIPVAPVTRYLKKKVGYTGRKDSDDPICPSVEVLFFDGILHGEMFLYPSRVRHIAERIQIRCGLPN